MNEVEDEAVLDQISQSEIVSFNIICRLCANPNERIIGIYSEEGISNNLAEKMNRYLPVQVSESDYLPLQCCWSCASTVLAWHELYLASVEADRRLRELEDLTVKQTLAENDFCDINEPSSSSEEQDIKSDLKTLATSLSVFSQDTPLMKTEVAEKDKLKVKNDWLQCNPLIDESLDKYMNNIETSFSETDESITKKEKTVKKTLKKNKTNKKKSKLEDVKNENDYEFNYSCVHCFSIFFDEESIINHMKIEHPDKEHPYGDNALSKKDQNKKRQYFKTTKLDLDVVNDAKVEVEGRTYYNCKICGKSLHSPYTYTWHMRIHTGERPYVCDLCGKQFRVSQGLIRHVRETHEGIKNYGCDLCGRKFATRRNVEEHRRIHTNERPYVCDLCGKSFKQKASLFVHSRSHKDSYPFKCNYCNLGFRARPPLLIHITKHTGEKPYPCDVCGRRFRIKYELKRHKLIHSEEKPFTCNDCGFSFRQKRYLRNHAKANHKRDIV